MWPGLLSLLSDPPLDYNRTIPSRNGGKKSGAAAIKRAAAKRRNKRRK